jgi:hypothetical protein
MIIRCIENESHNSNFNVGDFYELNNNLITTEWGGIRTDCEINPRCKEFEFAMCKFKVIS